PLEIERKLWAVEIFPDGRRWKWMGSQRRRWRFEGRNPLAVERSKPPVFIPDHFLNRCFAAKRAATAVAQGTSAEVNHVSVAGLCFDEVSVTGALKWRIGPMARAQEISVRMQFVRA